MQERIHSFSAVADDTCRVLVLGTVPGIASLELQQYYGHPRNAFWPIMGELFGFSPQDAYTLRLETLNRHSVALWDVLESCRREGSLDTDIRQESPNDIAGLLLAYPQIKTIVFNGKGAQRLYRKHVLPVVESDRCAYAAAPSTSPAYTLPLPRKTALWREILTRALE